MNEHRNYDYEKELLEDEIKAEKERLLYFKNKVTLEEIEKIIKENEYRILNYTPNCSIVVNSYYSFEEFQNSFIEERKFLNNMKRYIKLKNISNL